MPSIITCSGDLVPANFGGDQIDNVLSCDTGWEIVPYVEPTDSTAIYAQLVALNEFDATQTAGIIITCLVVFIIGFAAGVVIKILRRL